MHHQPDPLLRAEWWWILYPLEAPEGWPSSLNIKSGLFSWIWWSFRNTGITTHEAVLLASPSASSARGWFRLFVPAPWTRGQCPIPAIPVGYSKVQQVFHVHSHRQSFTGSALLVQQSPAANKIFKEFVSSQSCVFLEYFFSLPISPPCTA